MSQLRDAPNEMEGKKSVTTGHNDHRTIISAKLSAAVLQHGQLYQLMPTIGFRMR